MIDDKLNEIFDIDKHVKTDLIIQPEPIIEPELDPDIEAAKKIHRNLMEKSQDALDNLIEFAKASESPRAYEVVANLIKTTADVAKNLADISAKEKKNSQVETINNTQNNVFLTTTAELQKLLKGNKDV